MLPAARAGASFHELMISGKFQETIARRLPAPCRVQAKARPTNEETGGVLPTNIEHQPPQYCQVSGASAGSMLSDSPSGFPVVRGFQSGELLGAELDK